MCSSITNPADAHALHTEYTGALGSRRATLLLGNQPPLVIKFVTPGEFTVDVP